MGRGEQAHLELLALALAPLSSDPRGGRADVLEAAHRGTRPRTRHLLQCTRASLPTAWSATAHRAARPVRPAAHLRQRRVPTTRFGVGAAAALHVLPAHVRGERGVQSGGAFKTGHRSSKAAPILGPTKAALILGSPPGLCLEEVRWLQSVAFMSQPVLPPHPPPSPLSPIQTPPPRLRALGPA